MVVVVATRGRVVAQVLPLQEHVDLPERRPLLLLALPALAHEVPHLPGAAARARQQARGDGRLAAAAVLVEEGDVGDDLLVRQRLEGLRARERQHLPQRHAERPDVALRREFALESLQQLTVPFSRNKYGKMAETKN